MEDDKCRQRAFMLWRMTPERVKKADGGKHLETAQIDGVMMSCRSVWAKRFIEFNHSTLIFFFKKKKRKRKRNWQRFRYCWCFIIHFLCCLLSFVVSTFLFFHPTMQNNLQNGWISAYLQWVKWRCCIVVVKWFYCLISIHKIAYEIHFVGVGRIGDATHTHIRRGKEIKRKRDRESENGGV